MALAAAEILRFGDGADSPALKIFAPADDLSAIVRLLEADAKSFGEEPLQLIEGATYEYSLSGGSLRLEEERGADVVRPSRNPDTAHCGTIATGLSTGKLFLAVRDASGEKIGRAAVEVRSKKLDYRDDYRRMLADITDHCVDLLMDLRAPTGQNMEPEPGKSPETILQRFAFLRSLLDSRHFRDALQRVSSHPHSRWEAEEIIRDVRRPFRADAKTMRQFASAGRRVGLPEEHPLQGRMVSIPERVLGSRHIQTHDTPENRFVKFVLERFTAFIGAMAMKLGAMRATREAKGIATPESERKLNDEIGAMEGRLLHALDADVFRGVSNLDRIPLGSTVLQRKEGYREVYQAWLRFDMAARLVWAGGEDVYSAGQRNVAALYEYWVFFKLLEIVGELFVLDKPAASTLMEATADGFGLKLKSGEHLAFNAAHVAHGRRLRVQFSYNRSFGGDVGMGKAGSWTAKMRPDYTLSIWPDSMTSAEAERLELLVHVHFDAKYRIETVEKLFGDEAVDIDSEKREQSEGRYKRGDLLKMHAYRDAIRRTQGAYVLYPGDKTKSWEEYREILPGLGAFPLRPGKGDEALRKFIADVVLHVCDRASGRERQAYHTLVARERPPEYKVFARYPELSPPNSERHPHPAETHVLFGWVKDDRHLAWIKKRGLYNFRMDGQRGSLRLDPEVSAARYLLLHTSGAAAIPGLFRIVGDGPRVFSADALKKEAYPTDPSGEFYLVFEVESADEFDGVEWVLAKMPSRNRHRMSGWPFTISFDEVLSASSLAGVKDGSADG